MGLTRDPDGEGLYLVLLNVRPGKTVLTGTVRQLDPLAGDGLTTLRSITGLEGVTNLLTDPPFIIGNG
jgi:hypothetical protein